MAAFGPGAEIGRPLSAQLYGFTAKFRNEFRLANSTMTVIETSGSKASFRSQMFAAHQGSATSNPRPYQSCKPLQARQAFGSNRAT
jgi:hypothetical protein